MSRLLIIIFLFFIVLPPLYPQTFISGRGTFEFNFDFARFRGNDSLVYVEFYYSIQERALTYRQERELWFGCVKFFLNIKLKDNVIVQREWTMPHSITDTAILEQSQVLVGIETVNLPSGIYEVNLKCCDEINPSRSKSITLPMVLTTFPSDRVALSDIELSTLIQSSERKESMFYKNTLEIIPNAQAVFGSGLPFLYYYVEIYNLDNPTSVGSVKIRASISDAGGVEKLFEERQKERVYNAVVDVGKFNVTALKSGTYTLTIQVLDMDGNELSKQTKRFFIYKIDLFSQSEFESVQSFDEGNSPEYFSMSDEDTEREIQYLVYIMTPEEKKQAMKLTEKTAKKNFLISFWKKRHQASIGIDNEYRREYLERIEISNKKFSNSFNEGWKTERGRVYIIYGKPDDIERVPSSSTSNPYEIWYYNNIQGGVQFVFVDRSGFSDYILVHSTHRDEIHDVNWYRNYAQKMR